MLEPAKHMRLKESVGMQRGSQENAMFIKKILSDVVEVLATKILATNSF